MATENFGWLMEMKLLLSNNNEKYTGVQDIFNFLELDINKDIINEYFSILNNDGGIPFSKYSLSVLKKMETEITECGASVTILALAESSESQPDSFHFLGFDVSGDSFFHSPLFRTFFETPESTYFNAIRERFSKHLNKKGLFSDISIATEFTQYIRENNSENVFESDGNIRPIAIYSIT
ncbi:MAG: hypothetical protein PHR14_00145 [Oscillospiraceae bacterium]|nr:hypothetical protein [Oscillospiraceae bacterium]